MSKTITASFESIDSATTAASKAKDRCENISCVKVKYNTPHNFDNSIEPLVFANAFTPVDASTPSVTQTGMFPIAMNVDPIADYGHHPHNESHATVEITAKGENVNPICATLRQGGGISLKVR